MNEHIRTEREVAEIFAAANPVRVDRSLRVESAPATNGDRPPNPNIDPEEHVIMEPTTNRNGPEQRRTTRRSWMAGAAAATVVLVIGAALVITDGDEDDDPASASTPDEVAAPLTFDQQVAIAERFVAAFNEREALTIDELVGAQEGDITEFDEASELAWYDAFDWRWEDVECAPDDSGVTCEMTGRNKLTELSGEVIPTRAQMAFSDGAITELRLTENFNSYSGAAFDPFYVWVAAAYPTAHVVMWPADRDPARADSADLFERMLDEYVEAGGPPPPVVDFLAALAHDDADAVAAALTPNVAIDLLWATNTSELSAMSDLLDHVTWEWNASCRVQDRDVSGTTLSCFSQPTAQWVSPDVRLMSGTVDVRMTENGIASATTRGLGSNVSESLEPFWEWLRSDHPDDAADLLIDRDGVTIPVLTDDAVARLIIRIDEYQAVVGG